MRIFRKHLNFPQPHTHISAAKAWVVFDAAGAISASYNVASVTDNGVGDFTVNWATDFSSANYAVSALARDVGGGETVCAVVTRDAGTCRINTRDNAAILEDPNDVMMIAFGDQ